MRSILLATSIGAAAAACATPFNPSKNYFAGRAPYAPAFASTFSVSYAPSYKVLNVTQPSWDCPNAPAPCFSITTISVCGAPLPTPASLGLGPNDVLSGQLSAPLSTVGLTSVRALPFLPPLPVELRALPHPSPPSLTPPHPSPPHHRHCRPRQATYMPYLELLGLRGAATALPYSDFGPCVKADMAAGKAFDVSTPSAYGTAFNPAAPAAVAASALLRDADGTPMGKDIVMSEFLETTALGVAEYVAYIGAAFDMEDAAAAAFASMRSAYQCTSTSVAAAPVVPNVLWAYYAYGGWQVATCPNYYCGLVADAGGALLTVTGANGYASNDPAFLAAAAAADVFIYANNDWAATVAPNLPGAASPPDAAMAALLAKIPAIAKKRVFDIHGLGVYAWFEVRPGQPALMLADLASALQPARASALGLPTPTLLRNVFTTVADVGTSALTALTSCSAATPVQVPTLKACGFVSGGPSIAVGPIAGGIVGGVFGLACLALLAYFFLAPAKAVAAKTIASSEASVPAEAAAAAAAPGAQV